MGLMWNPVSSLSYRLYFLDDCERIVDMVELHCHDNGEALARAEPLAGGLGVELWCGTRRVAKIGARPRFWPAREGAAEMPAASAA